MILYISNSFYSIVLHEIFKMHEKVIQNIMKSFTQTLFLHSASTLTKLAFQIVDGLLLVFHTLLLLQDVLNVLPVLRSLAYSHQFQKLYTLFLRFPVNSHVLQHPKGRFTYLEGQLGRLISRTRPFWVTGWRTNLFFSLNDWLPDWIQGTFPYLKL